MPQTNYALQIIGTRYYGAVTSVPQPSTYYIGLSTTLPTQEQGSPPYWNFNEPTIGVNAYAREAVTNNTTNFGPISSEPASGYSIQNLTTITFTASTGAWTVSGNSTFLYGGLWDASTAGNLWGWGLMTPAVPVTGTGIAPSFAPSQLIIALT